MRFIGDVHGNYARYKKIIALAPGTIQVGDMGVGFRRTQGYRLGEFTQNPPHYAMLAGHHRFIRGNHDNPTECRKHSQYIPDGTVENGMMFIGGGLSIDKDFRIEGYSYWADEELSEKELDDIVTVYLAEKPRVMVTHDCPEEIAKILTNRVKLDYPSRTRQAFQRMLNAHSPKVWVFGHWHQSFDQVAGGTRFVCLDELEWKDIEV